MSQTSTDGSRETAGPPTLPRRSPLRGLWDRELAHYPDTGPRSLCLAIVVVTAIVLYYQLYIQGAVATSVLRHYNMSLTFFIYVSVAGGAVGAFGSLFAGLADRYGRANLVTYGLLTTGLLVFFGIPNAGDKWAYMVLLSLVSAVEGIILVATPALVRDFSPQLGRASAMGFWTLGPVIGSLVVTEVSSHTLASHPAWQTQFRYAGAAGLVVFVIALVGLRELSPALRGQLMVSMRDRTLVEAKARGLDPEKDLARPSLRQLLHVNVVGSAFAISIFLLLYFTLVGFLVVYFATNFGYSEGRANSLANWYWIANAVALVTVGIISDRLKVRKPFMVLGALISAAGTAAFAVKASDTGTGYHTFAVIFLITSVGGGMAYAPWMASFTETVEDYNPAAIATGLAIWGWVIRIVIAVALVALATIMPATNTLVAKGTQVQTLAARYAPEIATLATVDPVTKTGIARTPPDNAAVAKALTEIAAGQHVTPPVALTRLVAVSKVPKADLIYLQNNAPSVQKAAKDAPRQWRIWWWICFACQLLFIPFTFLMTGRWSPKKARLDNEEHERLVTEELAQLRAAGQTA